MRLAVVSSLAMKYASYTIREIFKVCCEIKHTREALTEIYCHNNRFPKLQSLLNDRISELYGDLQEINDIWITADNPQGKIDPII